MELVLAVLILACLHSTVQSDYQGDALYALKNSLHVPSTLLTDWNQNQVNPCTWSNVISDNSNNVVSVRLSTMNFSGTLSPRIGVLRNLKELTLKGNNINGEIPEEFGNLSNLNSLDLENNHLTGQIPSSLGNLKELQFLTLSQNNLNRSIPESLADLPNLINIQLDSNNLSGQIPALLFQIPKYNFTGNHLNCDKNLPHPCESRSNDSGASKKPTIRIIVGIFGVVLLFGVFLFFWCKAKHKGYRREVFVDAAVATSKSHLTFFDVGVRKFETEKRLDAIIDPNLNRSYNFQEVEIMIQIAWLCTQQLPEARPAMSEVVCMLEGEGLAERWEEWQHVEVTCGQEYERLQRGFD
ncbi:probable LRR receptor-like serine/threonine-protein kinase At5g10290 [Pistacia vera]|uniref:probable LRR receptor-like serine/threonine-protein kinase At5g10290 n=1 Tax=Pistacia vera TaxID=55513 RepID=UPI001262F9B8|nr:probable LRR receptor-like serine/threonine-protein kinase At5g10290 [Pistacia vera]